MMLDVLKPMETRLQSQLEGLVRDAAATRSYLSRINEIMSDISTFEDKLSQRVTTDELDNRMVKLQEYVPLKMFQGLQRIVSQKAEGIT